MDKRDIIKQILSRKDDMPDYRFTFGKHHGQLLSWVYKHDKDYLFWLYTNSNNLPARLEKFLIEEFE